MELQTAIEILEYHQEWRLGKREDMIHEPEKLTEALDIVLSEVKKFSLGAVSSRYLSAEKAKQMTLEALKEIAAKEYDTKCVLEQIEEATQNGSFEIQTYDDKKVRDNLVLLGYKCSEPFKSWNDIYMKVSWL